ncbi:Chaperone protein DnaJ [Spironucleus salmonicida]|uniref:Chaperone protein DnaJ n=1 Tax=Spironucleus salmonicida TaxID=348837 RepID=V6LQ92_9EUKA|nr:Chaperone protein DnaJ [Spironucleus salmonicida]|eukprot:EST45881.1 Chaperone protein DnaJ [Spironucleus salmonicida]
MEFCRKLQKNWATDRRHQEALAPCGFVQISIGGRRSVFIFGEDEQVGILCQIGVKQQVSLIASYCIFKLLYILLLYNKKTNKIMLVYLFQASVIVDTQTLTDSAEQRYQKAIELANSSQSREAADIAYSLFSTPFKFKSIILLQNLCLQNCQIDCTTNYENAFSKTNTERIRKNHAIFQSNNLTALVQLLENCSSMQLKDKIYLLAIQQNNFTAAKLGRDSHELDLLQTYYSLNFSSKDQVFGPIVDFLGQKKPKLSKIREISEILQTIDLQNLEFPEINLQENMNRINAFIEVLRQYIQNIKKPNLCIADFNTNSVIKFIQLRIQLYCPQIVQNGQEIEEIRKQLNIIKFTQHLSINISASIEQANENLGIILQKQLNTLIPDFYGILNVSKNFTQAELKKQYFKLSKQFHPDYNKNSSTEIFSQIGEAYQVLGSKELKRSYDQGQYRKDDKQQLISIFEKKCDTALHHAPGYTGQGSILEDDELKKYLTKEQWSQYILNKKMNG